MSQLPDRAQVVIVGGGIVGCSTAYHLTKRGWSDVVLLERKKLTSGTTWHAAGLVTTARPTHGMRAVVRRSIGVFEELEAETGLSTGYRRTGTLHLATNPARWEELRRQASACRASGIDVDLVGPDRVAELFPPLDPAGVVGATWFPDEGRGNATDTTMSLARGARHGGARLHEGVRVDEVLVRDGRAVGVRGDFGEMEAEVVVNCTGMWGRDFGSRSGVLLPLQALHHYYVVTEGIPGLPAGMPTIKAGDDYSYVKDEAGRLMVGFFEPGSEPWAEDGIPDDAEFTTLGENWEHLGPFFEQMIERIPLLADTGIRLFFCGPESFTPDGVYHLGEVPGLRNYFAACGFNSVGFLSGPGAGGVLADWIVDGRAPIELSEADPRRVMPHAANRRWVTARVRETLDLAYEIHWPYDQRRSARGLRRSPLHDRVAAAGAVFGEVAGWERADWYATGAGAGREAEPPTFGRPPWFEAVGEEHEAVREQVGLFDVSSFGKLLVVGSGAQRLLQRVSVADLDVAPGRIVYTQWCNRWGGIEADLTVTRLSGSEWLVLTAAGCVVRDADWLRRHVEPGEEVSVVDISPSMAMLPVMGPSSRRLLQRLTDADLSTEAFPFGSSRMIDLGFVMVRATRITYVGELGWELLVPADMAVHVYDTLVSAGADLGMRPAGYRALDTLRLEKGYRSWGHDVGPHDTPMEAGLRFVVAWDKPGGFIGRDALTAAREAGPPRRRLVHLAFEDPAALPLHDEPVYRGGHLVGRVTSSGFGYTLGVPVALAWVSADPLVGAGERVDRAWWEAEPYEVEVACERFAARGSLAPLYDPKSERVRA
ncbi:MAG TPA: FAD-dependent oxidoreductase [Acidimicrobiales bacterium]|nr:FAD-dependent oxidoreductase [Acidimicrobiales bacterium]